MRHVSSGNLVNRLPVIYPIYGRCMSKVILLRDNQKIVLFLEDWAKVIIFLTNVPNLNPAQWSNRRPATDFPPGGELIARWWFLRRAVISMFQALFRSSLGFFRFLIYLTNEFPDCVFEFFENHACSTYGYSPWEFMLYRPKKRS